MAKRFETLTIDVKQVDIKNGERCSLCECPIALAVKKQLPKKTPYTVFVADKVDFEAQDSRTLGSHNAKLPKKASSFIRDFDKGYEVKPFAFKLRVPVQVLVK